MAENRVILSPSGRFLYKQHRAAVAPGVNDDYDAGYPQFSEWIDTVAGTLYKSIDDSNGAAVWVNLGSIGAGGYNQLQEEGVNLPQRSTLNFVGPSGTLTDVAGVSTYTSTAPSATQMELANSIKLGAASGDPATPYELIGPGTFWIGNPSTPPAAPALKSDSSAWVAPVAMEIYGLATRQTAGVGAVARTYQVLLNDVAVAAAVQARTPASAGYVRIADYVAVAVAAGDRITVTYTNIAAETTRDPAVFIYARMP